MSSSLVEIPAAEMNPQVFLLSLNMSVLSISACDFDPVQEIISSDTAEPLNSVASMMSCNCQFTYRVYGMCLLLCCDTRKFLQVQEYRLNLAIMRSDMFVLSHLVLSSTISVVDNGSSTTRSTCLALSTGFKKLEGSGAF